MKEGPLTKAGVASASQLHALTEFNSRSRNSNAQRTRTPLAIKCVRGDGTARWVRLMVAILFAALIAISHPHARASQTLTLGYVEFPPVTFTDPQGKSAGLLINLANEVFAKTHYRFRAKPYPTARLVKFLESGRVNVFMGIETLPGLNDQVLVGEKTLALVELRAYSISSPAEIYTVEDTRGKRLILMRGYSYGGWSRYIHNPVNNVEFIEVDDHVQALKLLKTGRADVLLNYKRPTELALELEPIEDLYSNLVSVLDCRFIISKSTPGAQLLLHTLEDAFERTQRSGE